MPKAERMQLKTNKKERESCQTDKNVEKNY